jgi:hypothetical protein
MKKIYFLFALLLLVGIRANALTFDANGKAVVSFSDLTATGGLTFNQTTGELTNDGKGGQLSVTLPEEGIDMSKVTSIIVACTGDSAVLSYLRIMNSDSIKVNDWYSSKYNVNFTNYASAAAKVTNIVWYGGKTAGTMIIDSIVIKKTVSSDDGGTALSKSMFHVWTDATAAATVAEGTVVFTDGLNKELSKGATIYGNPNVNYLQYADLTGYDRLVVKGTAGQTVRSLFNRATNGGSDYKELKTLIGDDGVATINLKTEISDNFIHLNVIKVPNTASTTMMVTSLTLYKNDASGITEISSDINKGSGRVYNINGQLMKVDAHNAYGALHGLYIVNGKKILYK